MITRVVFEFAVERSDLIIGGQPRSDVRTPVRMRIGAAPSVRPVPFFQRWRTCEPGEEPTAWWTEPVAAGAQARGSSTDGGCWEQAPLGDVPPELLMTLGQLLAGGPGPRGVPRMEATTELIKGDPQYADALVIKLGTIGPAPFEASNAPLRKPDPHMHEALVAALGYAPGSVTWSRCLALVRETIGQRNEARTERDALKERAGHPTKALVGIATALGVVEPPEGWTDRIHDACIKAISDLQAELARALEAEINAFADGPAIHDGCIEALERLGSQVRPARGDHRLIGAELEGDSSIVVNIVTDYKRHLPIFLIKRRSGTTTALGTFFKIRCKTCHAWRPDSVADTVVAIGEHLREAHDYDQGWRWTQRPAMEADWLVSLE